MAISYIAQASVASNVTVPGTAAAGDLLVLVSFRDGSTTPPTAPTGSTSLATQAGTACSMQVAYVNNWNGSTTSYSSTNATVMVCHVYRGAQIAASGTRHAFATGTTNSASYPALNPPFDGSQDWVMRVIGTTTAENLTNPESVVPGGSGYTLRSDAGNASAEIIGWDTNGVVGATSVSSGAATLTGTAGNWISTTIWLEDPAAPSGGTLEGDLSSAGAATASFGGSSENRQAFSAAGVGATSLVGRSDVRGAVSVSGLATASAVGRADARGVLSVSGLATASFGGDSVSDGSGTFSTAGAATAAFGGAADIRQAFSTAGVGTAALVGRADSRAVATAAGTSDLSFAGALAGGPEPPVAGSGGGGWGDDAYYGTRRREQAKRDAERKLWKGEPARAVAEDRTARPTTAPEVNETDTSGAIPPEPDPLLQLLTLLAQPVPDLGAIPRPERAYDPEDDVAVLLLTDL